MSANHGNIFDLRAGDATLLGHFHEMNKRKGKTLALSTTPLALLLSACGSSSTDESTAAGSTLLTLTKSADTYSASAVTGFTLNCTPCPALVAS